MSIEPRELAGERGASSVALAQIVGNGSVREGLRRVEENVRDVIEVARSRGFVATYGGGREFYGLPAWQLLGATYGLLPFVEWTRPIDGGWEARATVRTIEGVDVGAAEAMATRSEPHKNRSSDHDLRAMAQTRAQRNALRSVLGSALVLAGFDFADPDAPATTDQTKALWTLADRHGWSREEAHERAGVRSLKELTREQASEMIDLWSDVTETGAAEETGDGEPTVSEERQPPPESGKGSASVASDEATHGSGREQSEEDVPNPDPWAAFQDAFGMVADAEGTSTVRRHAISHRWGWPPTSDWSAEKLDALAEIAREQS